MFCVSFVARVGAEEVQFDNPFDAIMSLFNFTGMEDTVKEMEQALDDKEGCRVSGPAGEWD